MITTVRVHQVGLSMLPTLQAVEEAAAEVVLPVVQQARSMCSQKTEYRLKHSHKLAKFIRLTGVAEQVDSFNA